ncbi:MAG: hypothetical protein IKQ35_03420 [Bacilli bacterium]|nr:hypothetical protein [Bacilli bacterium]
MKVSLWGYLFLVLGLLGIVLINVFGEVTISDQQNYYSLKEITKSAMLDAVDKVAYQQGLGYDGITQTSDPESVHCNAGVPGTVRIIKERFVELFLAKFSEEADLNRNYKITFLDIDECPPKVTVKIESTQNFSFIQRAFGMRKVDDATVTNVLSGILETDEPFASK